MSQVAPIPRGWFRKSLQNGVLCMCLVGTLLLLAGSVLLVDWWLLRGPLTQPNFIIWFCMLCLSLVLPVYYAQWERRQGRQTLVPVTLYVFLLNVVALMAFALCALQNLGYI